MNPKTLVPTVLSSRIDRGGQSVNIMHMRAWLLSNDNINHKHQQLQVLLAKGELYIGWPKLRIIENMQVCQTNAKQKD